MSAFFSKRICIKIPKYIELFYNQKKNLLSLIGPLGSRTLLLDFKLFLIITKNCLFITNLVLSKNRKLQNKSIFGSFLAHLKLIILELSVKYFIVLRLFGVGFKTYTLDLGSNKILQFKLGFSHFIFYKVPKDISMVSIKNTKIFLSNPSLKKITQVSSRIRSFKSPDPYKGKGILYDKKVIILKKGKKVY